MTQSALAEPAAVGASEGGFIEAPPPHHGHGVRLPFVARIMGRTEELDRVPVDTFERRADGGLRVSGQGARFSAGDTIDEAMSRLKELGEDGAERF